MKGPAPLQIQLLGPLEIRRGRQNLELPASKKTRGLLAYLIANGRKHRRDRLTDLLWDVADDPKGGLRWCLTKIRPLVDEPQRARIVADRETVEFVVNEADVDLFTIRNRFQNGSPTSNVKELQEMAALFRGTFLEGLDLPDYDSFQAWLFATREDVLQQQRLVLRSLVRQLSNDASIALPHSRLLSELDPLDEDSRIELAGFLIALGRTAEAKQLVETGKRLAREVGRAASSKLADIERALTKSSGEVRAATASEPSAPERPQIPELQPTSNVSFVGRESEIARLRAIIGEVKTAGSGRVVLISGEPGIGKTRLFAETAAYANEARATLLSGRSYEAEARRPYGPWVDGIRSLHPSVVGEVLRENLSPLLTGLTRENEDHRGKDQLFASIVELLAARAHSAPPVLLQFDDIQWCDEASAELLHYVVRMTRHRPVVVMLAARGGELPDNEAVSRVLRSFRRDRWMEEMKVEPLSAKETSSLVASFSPAADVERVFEESSGNPLYAIELALARESSASRGSTLSSLIADRIEKLPMAAGGTLRWAAVLGTTFNLQRLRVLAGLEGDGLMMALDVLDRHGLLKSVTAQEGSGSGMYGFTHGVVRRSVYDEISEPRRRLMHSRVAQVLEKESHSPSLMAEVAYHAALAGEEAVAARAAVEAGRYCLRVYANGEASAFARSGMRHASSLPEPERTALLIELMEVSLSARRPKDAEKTAKSLEELAERAMAQNDAEHARLGFHLLSYLRWEDGDWSNAKRHSLRAEFVTRGADARQQIVAMAEAARCLAMLERDLGHAEALALEAKARASHANVESAAISDALGMLRFHQGAWDDASTLFQSARELSSRDGDHLGEFRALEHLVALELERRHPETARTLCADLIALAAKLRGGSEAPFARCLAALAATDCGERVGEELSAALSSLRKADAKHRLAYALLRAAEDDFRQGNVESARARGEEALRLAEILERPSEAAQAHVVLLRAATIRKDREGVARHSDILQQKNLERMAAHVRHAANEALEALKGVSRGIRGR